MVLLAVAVLQKVLLPAAVQQARQAQDDKPV
jgi:hypothetical protein